MAPDIHHVEILRLVQLYKSLAVLQQVVGVVAGGFPCHKIVGHRKVVGVAHHAGVADAQRGQQGGDLRCPAAVGVGKAAHGVAHDALKLHTVGQHLPGGLIQRAAGDGGMVVGMTGDLMALVQLDPLALGDALGAGQAAVQVEGAPDAVAVEQLDKAAVLQTAVIIAHRQHLMLAAGEAGVNDLRFGVVHKQNPLFCQNLFEIRPQHIQCRGGIL